MTRFCTVQNDDIHVVGTGGTRADVCAPAKVSATEVESIALRLSGGRGWSTLDAVACPEHPEARVHWLLAPALSP